MKYAALFVALLLLFGAGVWYLQQPPSGPLEPVWDKTACAACAMHVGEPAFAAQWHAQDGLVHWFDDPGCLMLYWRDSGDSPRGVWFRHYREERWIASADAAFVKVDHSPMGFDIAAVDATETSDLDLAAARRWAEERF